MCIRDSPYVMMECAALSLRKHIGTFRLRTEKVLPLYFQYLGWCTWDAFYFDVDAVKLLDGLREFRRNGISIGSVIMDDGWLTTTEGKPIGSRRPVSYTHLDVYKRQLYTKMTVLFRWILPRKPIVFNAKGS